MTLTVNIYKLLFLSLPPKSLPGVGTFLSRRSLRSQTSNVTKWKRLNLSTSEAKPLEGIELPQEKRTLEKEDDIITVDIQHEKLADTVTPLWRLPYEEQLRIKYEQQGRHLQTFCEELRKTGTNISRRAVLGNKDEFNIRNGLEGKPVAGFFIGSPSSGKMVCVGPDKLQNMKPSHVEIAKAFEKYVQKSSWKVCEHFKKGGHWRSIIVRSNLQGDMMAIVIIHPQQLIASEIQIEMDRLKEYFLSGEGQHPQLKSLYFQACPHTRCTPEQAPFQLLFGETHLMETVDEFKFRISPDSFFQVNTAAAATLYKTVAKMLRATRMTTVLDLCCGTGTQGLFAARHARSIIGIELSSSAVKDARQNAAMNGVNNAEYYTGRVEEILKPVLGQLDTAADIAAIVNPARAGLGFPVVKALRECERIQRLVYVSCLPEGPAMENFVQLCQKSDKKRKGTPFRLVEAVPVDMFPQTNHCELLLLFERKS